VLSLLPATGPAPGLYLPVQRRRTIGLACVYMGPISLTHPDMTPKKLHFSTRSDPNPYNYTKYHFFNENIIIVQQTSSIYTYVQYIRHGIITFILVDF